MTDTIAREHKVDDTIISAGEKREAGGLAAR
jgi:hypothetical protein